MDVVKFRLKAELSSRGVCATSEKYTVAKAKHNNATEEKNVYNFRWLIKSL
ncbi:unnamed protein product [Amoebophrya sp. A120]|nr:unnamed protein product [Amoebophrya sp. A120]|eukprot:GSA120T00023843001.1